MQVLLALMLVAIFIIGYIFYAIISNPKNEEVYVICTPCIFGMPDDKLYINRRHNHVFVGMDHEPLMDMIEADFIGPRKAYYALPKNIFEYYIINDEIKKL